jgi:hypothetical protein
MKRGQQIGEGLLIPNQLRPETVNVTLEKHFSHPSLVIYFFATPPINVKLEQQIGGRLLIANQLRPQRTNVKKCRC